MELQKSWKNTCFNFTEDNGYRIWGYKRKRSIITAFKYFRNYTIVPNKLLFPIIECSGATEREERVHYPFRSVPFALHPWVMSWIWRPLGGKGRMLRHWVQDHYSILHRYCNNAYTYIHAYYVTILNNWGLAIKHIYIIGAWCSIINFKIRFQLRNNYYCSMI